MEDQVQRDGVQRAVTTHDLGAWLVKGNADRVDLAGRFALDPRVQSWCVQPGYRARLMAAGQRVVLWASGSRGRLSDGSAYGVWGFGMLAGPARYEPEHGTWSVPTDLVVLAPPHRIPREQLRADGRLAGIEVLRQPQAVNPSFLTVDQFTALAGYLGAEAPG